MAVGQLFETTDAGLRNLNAALETQIENMRAADQSAERLISQININFQADASTIWQGKVQEWRENYLAVTREVQALTDNLILAGGAINNAHGDAMQMAQTVPSTPAGNQIFTQLTNG